MHCAATSADISGGQYPSCAYCHKPFQPVRRWQVFCCTPCALAYDTDIGAQGTVAAVRRIKSGVSVTVHLTGPAGERALKLALREAVRVVRAPCS